MPNQTYTPSQMAAAIASIGQATLQTKTTTQNGTVTPDAGYDGLSEVVVNVPTGSSVAVEPLSVTQNGVYPAPSGKAYSPVTVEYQHPSSLTRSYRESLSMLEKNVIPQLTDEFRSVYNEKISPIFNKVLAYFFSD